MKSIKVINIGFDNATHDMTPNEMLLDVIVQHVSPNNKLQKHTSNI
jgi:hypothetical protein